MKGQFFTEDYGHFATACFAPVILCYQNRLLNLHDYRHFATENGNSLLVIHVFAPVLQL